jgi:hypothetical protein
VIAAGTAGPLDTDAGSVILLDQEHAQLAGGVVANLDLPADREQE